MNKKEKETQINKVTTELTFIIAHVADELNLDVEQKQRFIREVVKRINKEFDL